MARTKTDYGDQLYRLVYKYLEFLKNFKTGDYAFFTKAAQKYMETLVTTAPLAGLKGFTKEHFDTFVDGTFLHQALKDYEQDVGPHKHKMLEHKIPVLHKCIIHDLRDDVLFLDTHHVPDPWFVSERLPDYPLYALEHLISARNDNGSNDESISFGQFHTHKGVPNHYYDNQGHRVEPSKDPLRYPDNWSRYQYYPTNPTQHFIVLDVIGRRFYRGLCVSDNSGYYENASRPWNQYRYLEEYFNPDGTSYRDGMNSIKDKAERRGLEHHHLSLVANVYRVLVQLQGPKFWKRELTLKPTTNDLNSLEHASGEMLLAAMHRLTWNDEEVITYYRHIIEECFYKWCDSGDKKAYYTRLKRITPMDIINYHRYQPNATVAQIAEFFDGEKK